MALAAHYNSPARTEPKPAPAARIPPQANNTPRPSTPPPRPRDHTYIEVCTAALLPALHYYINTTIIYYLLLHKTVDV